MGLNQWIVKRNRGSDDEIVLEWRKCNEIHGYFDRLFDGVENCGEYPVTLEHLKELRNVCQWVLENHNLAEELLPTFGGIFFGSYEYDERYFSRLKSTVSKLDDFFEENEGEGQYYYLAWW